MIQSGLQETIRCNTTQVLQYIILIEVLYSELKSNFNVTGEIWEISILDFLKLFPNENYTEAGLRSAARPGRNPYKGIFKVTNL